MWVVDQDYTNQSVQIVPVSLSRVKTFF